MPAKQLAASDVNHVALCVLDYIEAVKRPLTDREKDTFKWVLHLIERRTDHGLTIDDMKSLVQAVKPDPVAKVFVPEKDLSGAVVERSRNGKRDDWHGVAYRERIQLGREEVRERLALMMELAKGLRRLQDELANMNAHAAMGYDSPGAFAEAEVDPIATVVREGFSPKKRSARTAGKKEKPPVVMTDGLVTKE